MSLRLVLPQGAADGGRVAEEGVAVAGQAVDALIKPVGLALSSRQYLTSSA